MSTLIVSQGSPCMDAALTAPINPHPFRRRACGTPLHEIQNAPGSCSIAVRTRSTAADGGICAGTRTIVSSMLASKLLRGEEEGRMCHGINPKMTSGPGRTHGLPPRGASASGASGKPAGCLGRFPDAVTMAGQTKRAAPWAAVVAS